jgi:ankyrin repeat protein
MEFSFDTTYEEDYVLEYLKQCDSDEEIYKCENDYGDSLLHMYSGVEYQRLQEYILAEDPSIVHSTNKDSMTPIYSAITSRNATLVRKIIEIDPHALNHADISFASPLQHEFSISDGYTEILDIIFHLSYDWHDFEELFYEAISSSVMKTKYLLNNVDNAYDIVSQNGNNVLHMACSTFSEFMTPVVKYIAEKTGDRLARVANGWGNIPLHCTFSIGNKATRIVYDLYPDGVYVQNEDGNTPMHLMPRNCTAFDWISIVVQRHPKILMIKNNTGRTIPMNTAARYYTYTDLSIMMYANPESFLLTDNQKRNILHLVCIYKPLRWWKIVDYILEKHLHLLFQEDSSGITPIRYGITDTGADAFPLAKEFFLSACLKHTPLRGHEDCWDVFTGRCHSLADVLGIILKRSKEEAALAFKFLPKKIKLQIQEIVVGLHFLEPETMITILSRAIGQVPIAKCPDPLRTSSWLSR